jgi:WD40 repeat protein
MHGIKIEHVCYFITSKIFLLYKKIFFIIEIAVSLGKNDVRIYHKTAGKWKLVHTLTEHLSRVLAIDWAPKSNRIVSASAVRIHN